MPCGGFGCAEDVLWLDVQVPDVVLVQMSQARRNAVSYPQPGLQASKGILLGLSLQRRHAPAVFIISSFSISERPYLSTLSQIPALLYRFYRNISSQFQSITEMCLKKTI